MLTAMKENKMSHWQRSQQKCLFHLWHNHCSNHTTNFEIFLLGHMDTITIIKSDLYVSSYKYSSLLTHFYIPCWLFRICNIRRVSHMKIYNLSFITYRTRDKRKSLNESDNIYSIYISMIKCLIAAVRCLITFAQGDILLWWIIF